MQVPFCRLRVSGCTCACTEVQMNSWFILMMMVVTKCSNVAMKGAVVLHQSCISAAHDKRLCGLAFRGLGLRLGSLRPVAHILLL